MPLNWPGVGVNLCLMDPAASAPAPADPPEDKWLGQWVVERREVFTVVSSDALAPSADAHKDTTFSTAQKSVLFFHLIPLWLNLNVQLDSRSPLQVYLR